MNDVPERAFGELLISLRAEYAETGSVDLAKWVRQSPDHAQLLTEIAFDLEFQGDLAEGGPPLGGWEDVGGVISMLTRRRRDERARVEDRLGHRLAAARRSADVPHDRRDGFRIAAVYAWTFDIVRGEAASATAYTTGKAVFLLEHALGLGLFRQHQRMAYGPFDPKLKYGVPRKVGKQRNWFSTSDDGSVLYAAEDIAEAGKYARRYVRDQEWAEAFLKYVAERDFEDLELLATVVWVLDAVPKQASAMTADDVLEWLSENWPEKVGRIHFGRERVSSVLERVGRLQLFPLRDSG